MNRILANFTYRFFSGKQPRSNERPPPKTAYPLGHNVKTSPPLEKALLSLK